MVTIISQLYEVVFYKLYNYMVFIIQPRVIHGSIIPFTRSFCNTITLSIKINNL
ncbi:hypothetical protein HanIR_Chr06g0284441 [Helianthus annuus]|nr:hypothetical protein HanIR_Chr06g0284441 [Helianthus annuus]